MRFYSENEGKLLSYPPLTFTCLTYGGKVIFFLPVNKREPSCHLWNPHRPFRLQRVSNSVLNLVLISKTQHI